LLLAPDNKTFVVKAGTVIGLYKGKVMKITRDRIIVQEHIEDYKGELIPREVVLELYEGGAK
jgi:Tfp pilus assembly protein PilP